MRFEKFIQDHKDELIRDLQGAVSFPSVLRQDGSPYPFGQDVQNCLEYMLKLCDSMGFKTHNLDNHVGWCEYGEGEEMVAVLGHLDVVPEGDGWTYPPYEGRVVDGRIYGRGTMDDKGPTMAALYGLRAIKDSGLPMKHRVRMIFGLNEETGSEDMKYYNEHCGEHPVMGFTPDAEYPVINGEKGLVFDTFRYDLDKTGAIRLRSLKGGNAVNIVPDLVKAEFVCDAALAKEICAKAAENITLTPTDDGFAVECRGVSAHGAWPEKGENAIGRLMIFLKTLPLEGNLARAVAFLADRLGMETDGASLGIQMSDEVSGGLTMNMGVIRGDETGVEVDLNYRYPVTKHYSDCGPRVKEMFEAVGFKQIAGENTDQLYVPEDSELVTKLLGVYREFSGREDKPMSIGGGTYAKSMPNVVAFGPNFPGDIMREHQPDEYMEVSRLVDNAIIYANAIYALAGEEK